MLSRVADSVFWIGRYLERADQIARFMEVNLHLVLDLGIEREEAQWAPLVATLGDQDAFDAAYPEADEVNVRRFLFVDPNNPNSILSCVSNARENARTVREVIPSEVWEAINDLYHFVRKQSRKRKLDDIHQALLHVTEKYYEINGLLNAVMVRNQAWNFVHLGMAIERADKIARLLDMKYYVLLPKREQVGSITDTVGWGALLRSAHAFEMYQKSYHSVDHRKVAAFLIFSEDFPRSMTFSLRQAARCLDGIEDATGRATRSAKTLDDLLRQLGRTKIEAIIAGGLHEFIDGFQRRLNRFGEALYSDFFSLDRG